MRRARFVAAVLAAWAAGGAAAEEVVRWVVRPPEAVLVSFHGLANYDAAGSGAGAMLYPAPNLVGFVAALATHGLLVDATKRSQRSAIQEKADAVLAPFKPLLAEFGTRTLLQDAISRMTSAGPKRILMMDEQPAGEWLIESVPEFSMTQDMRAIVLDNGVSLYRAGEKSPSYRNVIRVVSAPLPGEDATHWSEGEGKNLKEASARLWAHSVDIAIAQWLSPVAERPHRTIRYAEGGNERIERAEVLDETCARLTIRSLRGELMSVPARKVAADCAAPR